MITVINDDKNKNVDDDDNDDDGDYDNNVVASVKYLRISY